MVPGSLDRQDPAFAPMNASTKRVALVTGANKGLGFHSARQLAEAGLTVLLGARDAGRGQEAVAKLVAEGLDVRLLVIDVTSEASIAAAVKQVEQSTGRLDILVNNAGVSVSHAAPSQTTVDQMRRTYETNVFGVVAVTNAFLSLLRRSPSPRIVNVSSGLGSLALMIDRHSPWAAINILAYQSSKTALNAVTVLYARELREARFKVNAVNPGWRATDLGGYTEGAGDPAEGARVATRLSLIGDDGPTGEFHSDDGGTMAW